MSKIFRQRIFLTAIIIVIFLGKGYTQSFLQDSVISFPMVMPKFGWYLPGADLGEQFGMNALAGAAVWYKQKKNFFFGVEGYFLFGSKVKEDSMLRGIMTKDSLLITDDGQLAEARFYERGYVLPSLRIGKIFPVYALNKNSGFFVSIGTGFIQHKIRIRTRPENVPQLFAEYRKGYDRLTNGIFVQESIGYLFLGNRRLLNFMISIESLQAFTKNRRSFNFDTGAADTRQRLDMMTGISIGLILPLYKVPSEEYYYY